MFGFNTVPKFILVLRKPINVIFVSKSLPEDSDRERVIVYLVEGFVQVEPATAESPSAVAIIAVVDSERVTVWKSLHECLESSIQVIRLPVVVSKETIALRKELVVLRVQLRLPLQGAIV